MASLRFRLRQKYWAWRAPSQVRAHFARTTRPKLQIGTGPNPLPGWLNTTLYPFTPGTVFLDATKPFPMPDSSQDYIFSEHVIEHLEFDDAAFMLRECQRVLKPKGRIRLATPDLAQILAIYTNPDGAPQQAYIRWIMDNFRPQVGAYDPAPGHQPVLSRLASPIHLRRSHLHGERWNAPVSSISSGTPPAKAPSPTCAASSSTATMSAATPPCATRRWSSRRRRPKLTS